MIFYEDLNVIDTVKVEKAAAVATNEEYDSSLGSLTHKYTFLMLGNNIISELYLGDKLVHSIERIENDPVSWYDAFHYVLGDVLYPKINTSAALSVLNNYRYDSFISRSQISLANGSTYDANSEHKIRDFMEGTAWDQAQYTEWSNPYIVLTNGGTKVLVSTDKTFKWYYEKDTTPVVTFLFGNVPNKKTYYRVLSSLGTIVGSGSFTLYGHIRMMYALNIRNIRDFGGWETINGGCTKYELVYRGGQLEKFCSPGDATDEDVRAIKELWNLGKEIEFRASSYRTVFGDTLPHYIVNSSSGAPSYKGWVNGTYGFEKFIAVTLLIINTVSTGKSVYIHCQLGRDRTGSYMMVLEALLGVTDDGVIKDYELTSFWANGSYRTELNDGVSKEAGTRVVFDTMNSAVSVTSPNAVKLAEAWFKKYYKTSTSGYYLTKYQSSTALTATEAIAYLKEILLLGVTPTKVEGFLETPLTIGSESSIGDLAPETCGTSYTFPTITIGGVNYTLDPSCKVMTVFRRNNDYDDYSSYTQTYYGNSTYKYCYSRWTMCPIVNGKAYINASTSNVYARGFIYTIDSTNHTYTPVSCSRVFLADKVVSQDTTDEVTLHKMTKGKIDSLIKGFILKGNADGEAAFSDNTTYNLSNIGSHILNFYIHYDYNGTGTTVNVDYFPLDTDGEVTVFETCCSRDIVTKGKTLTLYENGSMVTYPLIENDGKVAHIYNLKPHVSYTYKLDGVASGTIYMYGNRRAIKLPDATPTSMTAYNIRDLGGTYLKEDGTSITLNYGMVYRGGELSSSSTITDATKKISPEAVQYAKKLFGALIEVRGVSYLSGVSLTQLPTTAASTSIGGILGTSICATGCGINGFVDGMTDSTDTSSGSTLYYYAKTALIKCFNSLANYLSNGKSTYFNCQAGADRTGLFAALILAICGVSEEEIYKDYELTSLSGAGYTRRHYDNFTDDFKSMLSNIRTIHPSRSTNTLLHDTEQWLISLGVPSATISTIQQYLGATPVS